MRLITAIMVSVTCLALAGCAHYSSSISATQAQLDDYLERSVAKLRTQEPFAQVRDSARPVWYEFRGGSHPQITVIVPVVSSRSNEFVRVEFDRPSGEIANVYQMVIH